MISSLAVAALALGPSTTPGIPAATVTTKYKLEIKAETSVDLSGMGGPVQVQTANMSAWLVLTLNDSAGGRSVFVRIDSLLYSGTAPVSKESVDSVTGAVVRGFVDAAGRVKNLSSTPPNSLLVGQIQGMVNSFFPKFKANAKAGDNWVDTATVKNDAGGNNTTVVLVTTYTADGAETVTGLSAVKLSTKTTSTVTGTIENPMAGTMEVEGTGAATGTLFVGAGGRLLGGSSTSNIDQKLKIAMSPTPIPVKTVQTVVVTVIP